MKFFTAYHLTGPSVHGIEALIANLMNSKYGHVYSYQINVIKILLVDKGIPDVELRFTSTMTLNEVQSIIRSVPDSNRMLETLEIEGEIPCTKMMNVMEHRNFSM
jgi:hypothetical protein